jgi:DAK2 domain fusion protein YloV
VSDPSLVRFRSVVGGALAHLESRRQEINDLNVFPVADGDTGDNMALTLRAVQAELDRLAADEDRLIDEIGRDEIVDSVARAALLGARGNSGVILSQLIRGAAEELISRPGELVDPVLLGSAMVRASDRAYGSVRAPAEGTILTVMREMAARVVTEMAHAGDLRLGSEADAAVQNAMLADILEHALQSGEESVRRGPDLLPILRESGVVDAGGHALVVLFAGVIAALRGTAPPEVSRHAPARVSHPRHSSVTYRYCTNFAVTGRDLDPNAWRGPLDELGDSVLVVGDSATLKVHLHTDEPERALALFEAAGELSHTEVADMRAQEDERTARLTGDGGGAPLPPAVARCGALAVVAGAGMRALFEAHGVTCLDGGATLNPSTYELLAGIASVPAEEVVVLPNSPNVVMAAERAAELSEKVVRVSAARTQQTGLVAALALSDARSAGENVAAVDEALEHLRSGAVARAARDDAGGRFAAGEAVGFVADEIVAWGEPAATLRAVLDALAGEAELVTCIAGAGAPLEAERVRALAPATVELELEVGGQPSYWWLLAAE